jgi:hypothetical protein
MDADDRIALVLSIAFGIIVVLPLWTYGIGYRKAIRNANKELQQKHAARVAGWRGDQLPAVPPIDPTKPGSILDTYGQIVFNAARLSFDGPSAPDQAEHARQYMQLHAEAQRLEAIIKSRLSGQEADRATPGPVAPDTAV